MELLRKVGPQTFAIIWMTKNPLGPECPYYSTFHYLFSGILHPQKKHEMSFFEATHFGQKLFLLHTSYCYEAVGHIKQFHNLIHKHRFKGAQMIFVGEKLHEKVKELIKSRLQSEYDVFIL